MNRQIVTAILVFLGIIVLSFQNCGKVPDNPPLSNSLEKDFSVTVSFGNESYLSAMNINLPTSNSAAITIVSGSLFIVDQTGSFDRVYRYDLSGNPLGDLVLQGSLNSAGGITTYGPSHFLILDYGNNGPNEAQIRKYDLSGNLLSSHNPSSPRNTFGIVDTGTVIYQGERGNRIISKLDRNNFSVISQSSSLSTPPIESLFMKDEKLWVIADNTTAATLHELDNNFQVTKVIQTAFSFQGIVFSGTAFYAVTRENKLIKFELE